MVFAGTGPSVSISKGTCTEDSYYMTVGTVDNDLEREELVLLSADEPHFTDSWWPQPQY